MCGSSRIARVESISPDLTVSFPEDGTVITVPKHRRAAGLTLAAGDLVMTRTVRRLLFVDYKLATTTPLTAPGTPVNVSLVGGDNQVTASWSAPTSGGAVDTYELDWRLDSAANWTSVTGIQGTGRSISSLAANTRYAVRVRARNTAGVSGWSQIVKATTKAPAVPGVPTNLTLVPGETSIGVTWGAPTSGGTPTSYGVRYRQGTTGSWTDLTDVTDREATITGLTASTSYQVEVQAKNNIGESSWVRGSATTSAPLAKPGPVGSLAGTPTQTTIVMSWAAPTSGGAVASYSMRHRAGGGAWTTRTGITTLSATITGLTEGTSYQVEVQAVNKAGSSAWDRVTVTTATAPAAPGPPTNLTLTAADTSIGVTWGAPTTGGTPTSYGVRYREGTTGSWTDLTDVTDREATITGLTASTSYQVEVQAKNNIGESSWVRGSATTTTELTLPTLTNLRLSPLSSLVVVSWTNPTAPTGATFDEPAIRWRVDGGTWTTEDLQPTDIRTTLLIQARGSKLEVQGWAYYLVNSVLKVSDYTAIVSYTRPS